MPEICIRYLDSILGRLSWNCAFDRRLTCKDFYLMHQSSDRSVVKPYNWQWPGAVHNNMKETWRSGNSQSEINPLVQWKVHLLPDGGKLSLRGRLVCPQRGFCTWPCTTCGEPSTFARPIHPQSWTASKVDCQSQKHHYQHNSVPATGSSYPQCLMGFRHYLVRFRKTVWLWFK